MKFSSLIVVSLVASAAAFAPTAPSFFRTQTDFVRIQFDFGRIDPCSPCPEHFFSQNPSIIWMFQIADTVYGREW